jgi:hypothetical protein
MPVMYFQYEKNRFIGTDPNHNVPSEGINKNPNSMLRVLYLAGSTVAAVLGTDVADSPVRNSLTPAKNCIFRTEYTVL